MDAFWANKMLAGACLLLVFITVGGFFLLHRVFHPIVKAGAQGGAPVVLRRTLQCRFGAVCCFLGAAIFLLLDENVTVSLVFVAMGCCCLYGARRLR
ncbi:MAG: hypothetical protein RRY29_04235 [Desulfovibrionaceae bacterium]